MLKFGNLVRIEKHDVYIAPLMVLTVDSNAGKSFVMVLRWDVIALGRDILFQSDLSDRVDESSITATEFNDRLLRLTAQTLALNPLREPLDAN